MHCSLAHMLCYCHDHSYHHLLIQLIHSVHSKKIKKWETSKIKQNKTNCTLSLADQWALCGSAHLESLFLSVIQKLLFPSLFYFPFICIHSYRDACGFFPSSKGHTIQLRLSISILLLHGTYKTWRYVSFRTTNEWSIHEI